MWKRFQPGEGPSRGLLRDYKPSCGPSFQALLLQLVVRLQAGTRWDLPLHQPQPGQWFIHNFQEDQNKSFIPPWQWWWRVQALVAASIVLGWAAVPALQWHTPQSCRGDRGVHSGLLARAT